jgi:cytidylate kinase
MTIVTINGQRGSGAPEIGMEVAQRLQYAYVDRQVLGEAAKRLGTTEEALEEKEVSALTGSRIIRALTRIINRVGTSGAIGDPFSPFGLGQDYGELMAGRTVSEQSIDDERFLEATIAVVQDLADAGDAVIVGRASNIILKDHAQALHVGLTSELSSRIAVVAQREELSLEDAEPFTARAEQARLEYFHRYFNVAADDPTHFHLMLNTHLLGRPRSVDTIVSSAQSAL